MKSAGEGVKAPKNGSHDVTIAEKAPVTTPAVAPAVPQNPFSFLRRVTEDLERQLASWGIETPWLVPKLGLGQPVWSPEIELVHRDGKLVVRADVPGTRKEDLTIEALDDRLVLKGERRSEEKEEREGYFRSERTYGSFVRTIPLPKGVQPETARADLRDGVLEITMDAPEEKPKGRTIAINA